MRRQGDPTTSEAKRAVAEALRAALRSRTLTKTELARRMGTSRSLVDRVLDPSRQTSLPTLASAAGAIGKRLRVVLVEAPRAEVG